MAPVTLHIYDISNQGMVKILNDKVKSLGTGAFHGGVEVFGKEWSFGYVEAGTGIFSCAPKGCEDHQYRESIPIGETSVTENQFKAIIKKMEPEYPGPEYDLLRKNCVIFCHALSKELGVEKDFPSWALNLAAAGATVCDGALKAADAAQAGAIMAAAKANEINEKYDVRGTAEAKAAEVMKALEGVDHQYKIRETGMALFGQAKARAEELDAKYNLRGQAASAAAALQAGATTAATKVQERASGSGGGASGSGGGAVQESANNPGKKDGGCPVC